MSETIPPLEEKDFELPDLLRDTVIPLVHGRTTTPHEIAKLSKGLNKQQVAEALGVCYKTMQRRESDFPGLSKFYLEGKANGNKNVVNALYKNALKGNVAAQIFWLKNMAGWRDKHDIEGDINHNYLIEATPKSENTKEWTQQFGQTSPAPTTQQ